MAKIDFLSKASEIESLVAGTRRRLFRNVVLTGVAWAVCGVMGALALSVGADLLTPMDVWLRVTVFVALCAVALVLTVFGVVIPMLRPPRLTDVAFRIEQSLPGMHNRLVTVLDLKRRQGTAKSDPAILERLLDQTTQRLKPFKVAQVTRPAPLRRGVIAAAVVLAAMGVLYYVFSDRVPTAVARILQPTAPIAPVSWVRLKADPGDIEALQGEPLTLRLRFERGTSDQAIVKLRAQGGDWFTYVMTPDEQGAMTHAIQSVDTSYRYQMFAGGTWTPEHRVTMLRRPIIEKVAAAVLLPDYMALPEPRPVQDSASQISAVIGSRVEVTASVIGEPTRGTALVYKANTSVTEEKRENELVWFDDDLPGDAESIGQWRWTADQVYSGARSHTMSWSRQPYGFKSRLSRLTVAPTSSLFIYANLDARETPKRVTVVFTIGPNHFALTWASPAPGSVAAPPVLPKMQGPVRIVEMGALPAVGRWVRLEAPIDKVMGALPPVAVEASEMLFVVDGGRVFFDRAGVIERRVEPVQKVSYEKIGEVAMERDTQAATRPADTQTDADPGARGQNWIGRIPVQSDCVYALEFANSRGHINAAMKPVPIVATQDQPPAVVVEKPGKNMTITEAQPMPLVIRTFDDYGIQHVWLQLGKAQDKLDDMRLLASYEQPQQNRMVIGSLDPKALELTAGASVYYRVVAQDRKGQRSNSETFRLGLILPMSADQNTAKAAPSLNPLLEGIAKLLAMQSKIASATASLLEGLSPRLTPTTQPHESLTFTRPDGSPMTDEEIRKLLEERRALMTPEQIKQMEQLDAMMAQERQAEIELIAKLDQAARDAKESPMSMPAESVLMQEMARQVREMAAEEGNESALDRALTNRLQELNQMTPEQQEELTQLQEQLKMLEAARAKMGQDPGAAQEDLANMLTQMQANQAMSQMKDLDEALEIERQDLEALRQRVAELQAQAKERAASEMDPVSEKQKDVDREAIKELKEAEDLLRERLAGQDAERDRQPPEPWTPPGQKGMTTPTEQDTPEKSDPNKKDKDKDKASATQPGELAKKQQEEEKKNWWDKPIDMPPLGSTTEEDERFANRDRRPTPEAQEADKTAKNASDPQSKKNPEDQRGDRHDGPPQSPRTAEAPMNATPREMLQKHQQAMNRHLGDQSSQLASAQKQLGQMSSQMKSLAQQMQQGKSADQQQSKPAGGKQKGDPSASGMGHKDGSASSKSPPSAKPSTPPQSNSQSQSQSQSQSKSQSQSQSKSSSSSNSQSKSSSSSNSQSKSSSSSNSQSNSQGQSQGQQPPQGQPPQQNQPPGQQPQQNQQPQDQQQPQPQDQQPQQAQQPQQPMQMSPQQMQAMMQAQQMMQSPQMQWAMAAAQRAAMQRMAAAQATQAQMAAAKMGGGKAGAGAISPAQQLPAPGGMAPMGGGRADTQGLFSFDLSKIDIGSGAPGIYRLPPKIREPLIQGMQEKGPEGYQRLIDNYYNALSKTAK